MQTSTILYVTAITAAVNCASVAEPPATTDGFVVMASEVETFQPCGASDPLWVDGDSVLLRTLRTQHQRLIEKPYETTYAVVEGAPGPQLDCGFCEDYPASFRIDRVLLHRRAEKSDCR